MVDSKYNMNETILPISCLTSRFLVDSDETPEEIAENWMGSDVGSTYSIAITVYSNVVIFTRFLPEGGVKTSWLLTANPKYAMRACYHCMLIVVGDNPEFQPAYRFGNLKDQRYAVFVATRWASEQLDKLDFDVCELKVQNEATCFPAAPKEGRVGTLASRRGERWDAIVATRMCLSLPFHRWY